MWRETVRNERIRSADGTGLAYQVVGRGTQRTILLANGLGGRLYAWEPLVERLWPDYRLITWDYRGLFESESPNRHNDLRIPHHASDARDILAAEGIERAVFIGWSMGVLVSLEAAALNPEQSIGMVLLNGIHGHVFETGFQPIFRLPLVPKAIRASIEAMIDRPSSALHASRLARLTEVPTVAMFLATAGLRAPKLRPMLRQYFSDVLGDSFENYLRLFQELDAHSVYHLLRDIQTPALVIAGALDPLAPAYQSKEIAKRMPNAELLVLRRASHFALLEQSKVVLQRIENFLDSLRW